jgi:hypothetical protein
MLPGRRWSATFHEGHTQDMSVTDPMATNQYGSTPTPPPAKRSAGLAITALVLGVLGFFVITIPISIILGIIALVKSNQKGKPLAAVGIVLALLWAIGGSIGIYSLVNAGVSKVTLSDVKVGDCILQDKDTHLSTVVDCAQTNTGKVYAIPALPEGAFPGDTKVQQLGEAGCVAASGRPADESKIVYIPPTETQWKLGVHKVFCLASS